MLKQTIEYTDYNGVNANRDLYFNITKNELLDRLEIQDRFIEVQAEIQRAIDAGEQNASIPTVRKMLGLVREVMEISYGEKSEDGEYFNKGKDLWERFQSSAAYDAFLLSLFEDWEKAAAFLLGVMPQDLVEAGRAQVANQGRPVPQDFKKKETQVVSEDLPVNTPDEAEQLRARLRELEGN